MTADTTVTPPAVLWAQRKEIIFLTFNVECADPEIKFEKDSLYFKGVCGPEKKNHELKIELYGTIKPEECLKSNKGRLIEIALFKEDKEAPFWPTLTKDKKKHHWLKVDFNKWVDEDDSEDEGAGPGKGQDFEEMIRSMGGLNTMGGDAKPSLDDLGSDSDDEELPDLE